MYLKTQNDSRKRAMRRPIFTVAAIAVIVAVMQYLAPHLWPSLFMTMAKPFWQAEFSISSGSLKSPEALLNENEALKRDLSDAAVRLATVQALQNENTELKTLLGRPDPSQADMSGSSTTDTVVSSNIDSSGRILAAVLAKPAYAPYDELTIDGGTGAGISIGNDVYAMGDIPIGTVIDVFRDNAKVVLYSSPGQTHQVMIGSGNVPASAVGRGGGQYSADIPQAAPIKNGDVVIAPSLDQKPFGIVSAVLSDPAKAYKTVLFAPPVNIYEIKWVFIEPKHAI